MADIQELQRALIEADKVGDVAAATALAKALRAELEGQENQPEMRAREVTLSDRAMDFAKSIGLGPTAENMRQVHSGIPAFVEGAAEGLTGNYSDEIIAGLKTGFGFLGDYGKAVEGERARMAFNKETSPKAAAAGNIAGAVGMGVGMAKSGLSLVDRLKLASLPKRAMAGIAEGAGYGALYGSGAGEGIEGKAMGGATGALFGAGIGGTIPVVGAGLRAGYNAAADRIAPALNAVRNPEMEAARRVALTAGRTPAPLSAADEAAAITNQQPLINADRGGEYMRDLSRAVTNESPEASDILKGFTFDRYNARPDRAKSVIDRIVGGQADDLAYQENIQAAAKKANAPRYAAAENAPAAQRMFDAEFADLLRSPAIRKAAQDAETRGANRAVADGTKPVRNPFNFTDDGKITLRRNADGSVAVPNLRFWDQVKRNLDSQIGVAQRANDKPLVRDLTQVKNRLVSKLDAAVPEYKAARVGAAGFFDAEDALEAGKKFVSQQKDIRRALSAMGRFTPEERDAFRVGFAAELRERVANNPNVIDQIFKSGNAKEKIRAALGKQGADEFETFIRIERQMDMLKNAVSNNSTSKRQFVMAALAYGAPPTAGGLTGLAVGGDMQSFGTGAAAMSAARWGASRATAGAQERVMKRIAEILISDDPNLMAEGIKKIAKTEAGRKAVEKFGKRIEQMLTAPAVSQTAD